MKKLILFCLGCFTATILFAQKLTYDLVIYSPPAGWKSEEQKNLISYTTTNKKKNSWCQIFIVKSTASKGSIEADFESEWQELAVKNYHPTGAPVSGDAEEAEGWKIKSGMGKFVFNNSEATVLVTTFSGYNRCASIVAITNSQDYMKDIETLMGSLDLQKQEMDSQQTTVSTTTQASAPVTNSAYAFTTTNFNDGWTSTVQEDWVEVTKENIKVLLHYPKEGTIFPADPAPLINKAWEILVAPRYSNLKEYKTTYISTFDRPYLGMGTAVENATGKEVFVVLFRQGKTGWLEFVTPDKNTFVQYFKFDPTTIQWDSESDLLKPLIQMSGYNKFAVAATDFVGKWTSDFTGIQQLYSVYTGEYAGMHMNQSSETFQFSPGNSYSWDFLVINGMAGNAKYVKEKSTGTFTIPNNWQVQFSDIEGKPKLYDAYFSYIKGGRLLWMNNANAPGSGIFSAFGLAK